MTQEQKAKAYDEALEIARKINSGEGVPAPDGWSICEVIFPELKESEDEKIRKELIDFFKKASGGFLDSTIHCKTFGKWLAWLEKQGEKSSWKPSKEEMDALYGLAYITNKMDDKKDEAITKLYQELKREFFNEASYENMFPNTEEGVRRRSTIQVLEYARSLDNYNEYGKADIDKNIAWLEKQGEQKPYGQMEKCINCQFNYTGYCNGTCILKTNEQKPFDYENATIVQKDFAPKVEPKFKVGDWVILCNRHESIYQVEKIENYRYYLRHYLGGSMSVHFDNKLIRLWTIQDAKDGDVLVTDEMIVLFKKKLENDSILTYFHYDTIDDEYEPGCHLYYAHIYPATKEQRDLLFQKMREAGYEWNEKEKRPIKVPKTKEETGILKQLIDEEKSAWSKEDVHNIQYIDSVLFYDKDLQEDTRTRLRNWLKSLKDRVQPQLLPQQECEIEHIEHGKYYYCIKDYYSGGNKRASKGEVVQAFRGMNMMALGAEANEYFIPVKCIVGIKPAWSEEDENHIQHISDFIMRNRVGDTDAIYRLEQDIKWLKSLRPQNKWKPSDEQLNNILDVLSFDNCTTKRRELLESLYNDLKKLREE